MVTSRQLTEVKQLANHAVHFQVGDVVQEKDSGGSQQVAKE